MRPLRSITLAVALVFALTGCVSTSNLESDQTPEPTPTRAIVDEPEAVSAWTEGVEAWVPLEESIDGMPGVELAPEYSGTVSVYERGDGACATAATRPGYLNESCTPPIGAGRDALAVSSGPVDYMFAAGATLQVAGNVTGLDTASAQFTYGMSAWRFGSSAEAQTAPVIDAVSACGGVIDASDEDVRRLEIRQGDEPHLRLIVDGDRVFLFRSLHLSDGPGLGSTGSGMLPTAAVDHIETWWRDHGLDVPSEEP